MKIDKTLEGIAKETVEELKTKNIEITNQDVYRCLDFVINCIGLAVSKVVPIEIPYLGKIIPKVRINRNLGRELNEATTDEEKDQIKKAILVKSATKKQKVIEYKNQKAFTEKEAEELLEGYIDKNNTMLRFAFNEDTKKDFLEKLNTTSVRKLNQI